MIEIVPGIYLTEKEIKFFFVRSSGPGGQNVNKVSTAVHLRFDIRGSSLPDEYKKRLLESRDSRLSGNGVLIIKAGRFRSRVLNRQDALKRLKEFVMRGAPAENRPRIATRPSRAASRRRIESKKKRGKIKSLRKRVVW